MKKTVISLIAVLALVFALSAVSSFAATVVPSSQKLVVNNEEVNCDIYNIDGSNYFKLRDIAAMINETPNNFAVGWDEAAQTISVTKRTPYELVGGELETGTDKSGSAVASAQKLLIDGAAVEGLSVYNIGGNNFFKLRDLGDALGFTVDYDAATKTMIVNSYDARTAAESNDITAKAEEEQTFENLIFSEDVTITGTAGKVTFINCEFKGNVINKGTDGLIVDVRPGCTFADSTELIISNGKKEADMLEDDFPKFIVYDSKVNVVFDDCFGNIVAINKEAKINGKVYTSADVTLFYDEKNTAFVPYTDQTFDYILIGQCWEASTLNQFVIGA